jgi:hypothetical protein
MPIDSKTVKEKTNADEQLDIQHTYKNKRAINLYRFLSLLNYHIPVLPIAEMAATDHAKYKSSVSER